MTIETIQPESETQKTIIKPFTFQSRYANEKNHHKNLSLFKQDMRNKENLHDAFLFNRGMRKEVRSHICDRPRVIPLP